MKKIELPSSLGSIHVPNCLAQASTALFVDLWKKQQQQVAIVVGESIPDAENKCEDIAALYEGFFSGSRINFHTFDKVVSPDNPDAFEKACDRLTLLSELRSMGENTQQPNPLLVATTIDALLGSCPRVKDCDDSQLVIRAGEECSYEKFSQDLINQLDYSSEVVCEEPGQFAIRGGLIDVYPVNADFPVRIDFFGDTVEEIRKFDPTSQRSSETISEVKVSSINDKAFSEREGEFFHYLDFSVLWLLDEPENLLRLHPLAFHETGNAATEKANLSLAWKRPQGMSDFFFSSSEINAGAGIFDHSKILNLQVKPILPELDQVSVGDALGLASTTSPSTQTKCIQLSKQFLSSGLRLFISIGADAEKKRIVGLLKEHLIEENAYTFLKVGLHRGFYFHRDQKEPAYESLIHKKDKGLAIVTSREILGRERSRRPIRSRKARVQRKEVDQALDFSELVDGDLLVHLQHGICRFCSLGKIEQQGKTEEAISVEFADGILLHIPLQESHLLSRYIGLKKAKPKLAKLGGKSWAKTREAAEIAAIDLAADLLRLQASRDSERGFSFSPDDKWQKEFEDSFPYSETPDQLRSIVEVKEDMESDKPMDRLVCGDVGYGKTEVAMRAAFKAMMDGKQVALLAPTTILCQQHMESFLSRMADFPVVIEMLSRFRTPAQQKKTLQGIQSGSVDMLIGTHRMFSDGLTFKDLGLLIIDEEQRFGVDHKEKLKRLKANVDVLTLSATPIPRTLYFAMVGVRSFSTIETAPVNRRPIRTEVVRKSDDVLKKAIQLELHRGGQVFYLHNRVKTIHVVAKKLQKLMPGLRVAVGHGQMAEAQLEQVMVDFISGKYDLLLCTTIIESGLDIPNCNTIIIEEADKFGLSQLYQLRGRVGRFTRQAYAYLLVNPSLPIKDKAKKRLSALRATSSMGAGFKIALRDLELRGAGNLLGSEQSGHIAGVGFEVYCRLLRESVSRLKGDEIALRPHAVVRLDFLHTDESIPEDSASLNMASCLPESYMNEPRLRIDFYRKIAAVMEIESLNDLRSELRDRFGPLPSSVEALFMEVEIKCLAQECGFDLIATKGRELQCRYVRRSSKEGIKYLRKLGNLPCLNEKQPLLKLKEIIRFLKLHIHGNT